MTTRTSRSLAPELRGRAWGGAVVRRCDSVSTRLDAIEMAMHDTPARVRELWRVSAPLRLAERAHLAARLASAPWERVLEALEPEGSVLDVGCGPGLLAWHLARSAFAGTYLGIDPDARKVERARRWLPEGEARRFRAQRIDDVPERGFARAAIVDVLYLVPEGSRAALVSGAAARLAPRGLLLALTSGGGPRWKRALDRAQERVAVATGMTRGEVVAPCDGAVVAALLHAAGLRDVAVRDAGDGYLHGFEIVVGRAP